MIECVTIETAHLFGDAIASQYRLRHKVFIQRQNYNVPTWHGMEYDQYDTPATIYCIWRDDQGIARGVARIHPTDRPYMIKDLWPQMVTKMPLPSGPAVWEATRLGVDQDLPKELRRRILSELVLSYQEVAHMVGAEYLIGVMPTWAWEHCFERLGWKPDYLGAPILVDEEETSAARLDVSLEVLQSIRAHAGIRGPVLMTADHLLAAERKIAA